MTARPTTEQLLVQVLLRSMQEVLRALREAGSGAESATALEQLTVGFAPVWLRLSFLTLDVVGDTLEWEERRVLDSNEDPEGLVRALKRAGITSVTLVPGVEAGEVERFLAAIDRARSHGQGDGADLLTALFREDLQYVRHSTEPDGGTLPTIEISTVLLEDLAAGSERVKEAVRADAGPEDRARGVVQLEKFDSTLYFLDQREIQYLRTAIDREYAQDLATNALGLLLDILEKQADPQVRAEVIGILEDLMPYLFSTGRFEAVAYVISEVRAVARDAPDITTGQKESLDRLRASVSETEAIAQLFYALESGRVQASPESLGVLLRELRPQAIRSVLAWLDALTKPEAKAALGEAVDGFFTEWPQALQRMLSSPDEAVVKAALELAARLRLPAFVDLVADFIDHDDDAVRTQVASTLAAIGSGPALRTLVKMATDVEPDVRVIVYETVANRSYRGAATPLQRAMAGKELEKRGLREKRALFRAYGTVAGPGGVAHLEPLLKGKNPRGPRPSSETRACAAMGLGLIGTPGARAALKAAAGDKDPMVRTAASSALRAEA